MKVAIRFEVVMEYEVGDPSAEHMRRWLEDSHCHSNIANALTELVKSDDEHSVCNICRFSKVTLLPPGTDAYKGYVGERSCPPGYDARTHELTHARAEPMTDAGLEAVIDDALAGLVSDVAGRRKKLEPVLAEVRRLSTERDCYRALLPAFLPLSVREMVSAGDLAACKAEGLRRETWVKEIHEKATP